MNLDGFDHSRRPSGARRRCGREFLSRHGELIVATDFFTVEVWTRRRLQRFIILFFIDLSSRKVEIAGIAQVANGLWMSRIARNLTGAEGILTGKRYLIHDRDPLFTAERNHQGLANQLISPEPCHLGNAGEVQRRQRLGGMLNYYRAAGAAEDSGNADDCGLAVRSRKWPIKVEILSFRT